MTLLASGVHPWAALPAVLLHAGYLAFAAYRKREFSPHRILATRADAVTLLRSALGATLIVYAIEAPTSVAVTWVAIVLATTSALLDVADGVLARRDEDASAFGAWFDQETDALFVLILSACVWRAGHVGPWVLAAGLWRYGFVALRILLPRLRGPLDDWPARRVVCVTQIVVLIVALAPFLPAPLTPQLVFASLCLLTASFVRDLVTLWRNGAPKANQRAIELRRPARMGLPRSPLEVRSSRRMKHSRRCASSCDSSAKTRRVKA